MDRELAALRRGYREERRRMFHDREAEAAEREAAEREATRCPFDRAWCSPDADLDAEGAMPCLSCYLRRDRDDDPHPDVAAVADADGDAADR